MCYRFSAHSILDISNLEESLHGEHDLKLLTFALAYIQFKVRTNFYDILAILI